MQDNECLRSAIWTKRRADVITAQGPGLCLPHGIAYSEIVRHYSRAKITLQHVQADDRISVRNPLCILIGNVWELGENVRCLIKRSSYPYRFEIVQLPPGCAFIDHCSLRAQLATTATLEDVGLVFRGRLKTMPDREVLLFAGTTPKSILGAVRWALQNDLNRIPVPAGFPAFPIEVVIRFLEGSPDEPDNCDFAQVLATCEGEEFDWETRKWEPKAQPARVRVEMHGKTITDIYVGDRRVTRRDLRKLLKVLICQSFARRWTTIAMAQYLVDGIKLPETYPSFSTRLSEIRKLAPQDPNFIEARQDDLDSKLEYRMNAIFDVPSGFAEIAVMSVATP